MQIDTDVYLSMCEKSNNLLFFDIEATGLKGDYDSILCISFKPYGKKAFTLAVDRPGNDKKVVDKAADVFAQYDCWVSYFGKGYDIPLIQTRRLSWGLPALKKHRHLDVYYSVQPKLNLSRRSLAHALDWLHVEQRKMSVSADTWRAIVDEPAKHMKTMIRRCESDCEGLEGLYERTKHLVDHVTR